MANEAALAIVARFRDEASADMKKFGGDISQVGDTAQATGQKVATVSNETLRLSVAAMSGAHVLSQFASMLRYTDNDAAKAAGRILSIGSYVISTTMAIANFLPMIQQMITALRTLAVTQTVLKALSGPAGMIGLGVAAGAVTGLAIASANSGGRSVTERNVTVVQNVQGSIITEKELGQIARREIIKQKQRGN